MNPAIINVSEIDALKIDGSIQNVDVRFTVHSEDADIKHFFPGLESVTVPFGEMPKHIQQAINLYVDISISKIPIPTKVLFGNKVEGSPDLRHIGYMINRQETSNEVVWLRGYYSWANKQKENLEINLAADDFTEDQLRVFLQLKSWAREISETQFKKKVVEAIGAEPQNEVIVKRSEVLISYKNGEGDNFANDLFHRIGQSGIFVPRLDTYDLEAGPWIAQLERLLLGSAAMIPIITPSYEAGNISQLERDLALIREREAEGFRLVPALLTSEPEGFLRAYQRVDFRNTIDDTKFNQLIDLIGGVKRNPYG